MDGKRPILISNESRQGLAAIMREIGPSAEFDDAIQLLLKEREDRAG